MTMSVECAYDGARVCNTCRVLVVLDADGQWVHPPELREKFSLSVCDLPRPGREARGHDLRYGRGRAPRNKLALHAAIEGLDQPPGTPLTVATDASYKAEITEAGGVRKPFSWGYLTTSGLYGLGTTVIPGTVVGGDRALQGELRAMYMALTQPVLVDGQRLLLVDAYPIIVLTDSLDAVQYTDAWQAGEEAMPPGYTTDRPTEQPATLIRLARLIYEAGDRVQVRWVRGHSGHPLNEAADALAKLARAWASKLITPEWAAANARAVALAALQQHAASL
jgi:ribonuclease HI